MNELSQADSLYLKQHASNPVHWKAWGESPWQQAREASRLVIVSVGYSACHWCHVMEREVFEQQAPADLMNAHFVSIKVDREEHPTVDALYMTAVQIMTRSGGWPLNVVCLPDGRPVWGSSYVPMDQWMATLLELVKLWKQDPDAVLGYAERLSQGVKAVEGPRAGQDDVEQWSARIGRGLSRWRGHWDPVHGGSSGAPKFPLPFQGLFLSQLAATHPECGVQAQRTLMNILGGGMHDHVGGGFGRYAVDEGWRIPHFEKMLSDQGPMLAWLAAAHETASPAHQPFIAQSAHRLVDGVCRDFDAPGGGFYASLDADSEGAEGRYYWWTVAECEVIFKHRPELGAEARRYFDWSGRAQVAELGAEAVVPMRPVGHFETSPGACQMLDAVQVARRQLRHLPARDEQVVTAHTAWMAWGLIQAGDVWKRGDWTERGLRALDFLHEQGQVAGQLSRIWQSGTSRIPATLADYAAFVAACLRAHASTGQVHWAHRACELTLQAVEHFQAEGTPLMRSAQDPSNMLFAEQFDCTDDVLPSANAVMAENFHTLGFLFGRPEWMQRAKEMVAAASEGLEELSSACFWGRVAWRWTQPYLEVVVAGPAEEVWRAVEALRSELKGRGWVIPLVEEAEGLPIAAHRFSQDLVIYSCQNGVCDRPIRSLTEALNHVQSALLAG